jgi:helicase
LLEATPLGRRVAELYIDPYTANFIITSLRRATQKQVNEFSFLSMGCNTIEIKPAFKARSREITAVEAFLNEHSSELIILEPSVFEPQYDDFLDGIKTALVFIEWMDEKDEEYMLETYGVTPGEFKTKLDIADWILYAAEEMASLLQFRDIIKVIRKTRFRLDHGIKEELIPLVRLRGIGRKRARKLFRNGIKDLGDVKAADLGRLSELIGRETAISIKREVGMDPGKEMVPEGKRKGQISMKDYQE